MHPLHPLATPMYRSPPDPLAVWGGEKEAKRKGRAYGGEEKWKGYVEEGKKKKKREEARGKGTGRGEGEGRENRRDECCFKLYRGPTDIEINKLTSSAEVITNAVKSI